MFFKMETYKNLSKESGVNKYLIEDESIVIQFKDGGLYVYNYTKPGKPHVERMKKLAQNGKGLSTFISTKIKKNYFSKLH